MFRNTFVKYVFCVHVCLLCVRSLLLPACPSHLQKNSLKMCLSIKGGSWSSCQGRIRGCSAEPVRALQTTLLSSPVVGSSFARTACISCVHLPLDLTVHSAERRITNILMTPAAMASSRVSRWRAPMGVHGRVSCRRCRGIWMQATRQVWPRVGSSCLHAQCRQSSVFTST